MGFNPTNALKDIPLRHSFFFTGMNSLRNVKNESADPLSDHVNSLIRKKQQFHRGFYSSMRGDAHLLPIPFPRIFTPFALNEGGEILPELTPAQREESRIRDEFVLKVPSLVKLAHDGAYLNRVEDAYTQLRKLKAVTRMHLLKENTMEADELTEVTNNLANLVENFK